MSEPRPPATNRGVGDRMVIGLAIAVYVGLGWVWSISTPVMDSPDEPTHTVRAAAVWQGTLHGEDSFIVSPVEGSTTGAVASGTATAVRVPRAYAELQDLPECYKFQRTVPAGCAPAVSTDETIVDTTTYVGTYQPTYYLLVGWPSRLLDPHDAIYAMRLLGATIGGVLLGWGVASAYRATRRPFVVVGAALAATPMAVFLMSTINPSGLEISAAFATWLGLLQLVRGPGAPSSGLVARVAIAAALFALTRPLSPVFLAVTVGLVLLAAADRARVRELIRLGRVQVAVGLVVALTTASAIWVVATQAYDAFTGISVPGLTWDAATREHLSLWGFRARQLVGYLGHVDAPLPSAVVWLWIGTVVVLAVAALWLGTLRQRLALGGALIVLFAVPLVSEATRAATYGFIWQGRYSLPTAIGVPVLAAWMLAESGRFPRSVSRTGAGLVAVGVALGHLVAYLAFMTRVVVGYPDNLVAYLGGDGWAPPLPSALLLLGATVATGSYGALLWRLGRDEPVCIDVAPATTTRTSSPTTPVGTGERHQVPSSD